MLNVVLYFPTTNVMKKLRNNFEVVYCSLLGDQLWNFSNTFMTRARNKYTRDHHKCEWNSINIFTFNNIRVYWLHRILIFVIHFFLSSCQSEHLSQGTIILHHIADLFNSMLWIFFYSFHAVWKWRHINRYWDEIT